MLSISGYQILEQLYNGLRTLVYRAIREADKKPVVIKILKNSLPDFSELVQFRNQYIIASRFNYPGIIQTYSLENYQNSYALVMEDIQGISLRKYMLGENIASLQDILSIAVQVSNILGHIHHNRVIHKDIKPDNILINPQTKEIKLIDFSIASLLPKETQEIKNPNVLEGTLAYLSPEQTGRMNRGVDFRADFYAFGVTLFELLTGELPFKSDDAVELVHCHIAKQPPNINKPHPNPLLGKERAQEIPEVIGNIVIKLMAKNAEDRYQSALGLKHDLELCLKQIKETGKIENFEIPQRDICDQFIIPEKLYGRESEVEQLLAAFDRVGGVTRSQAQPGNVSLKALPSDLLEAEPVEMHYKAEPCNEGKAELMLVAGFSGIGKTAIVNEVHKPIVKQRGYFIKGKFDQFNRNIPFSAFVQAFRDLMGQLLSENDAQLSSWKHQILQALGENARIIIDVIPELEQIIGKQLPAPELSGTAAQNRFNLLFQKFIQVFTTKEHPLVVFLDDLQWADSASLNLMQLLLSESESRYLLLIGAYRDNEVFPAHPLILTLEEIAKASAIVNTITLTPLKQESLNQLVADTLNCASLIAQPLTELIYQKTQGNPFFSTQFLKVLYEDSLIEFDFNTGSWVCDITKVKALALTDDVVEFMALQLQKLPESTQNVLKLAACIGNQFDLKTLAVVSQNSEAQTALFLWEALQSGLILPQSEVYKFYLESETNTNLLPEQIINYKFLHDRVQQAAYSLIPDNQKQKTHYHIGQLLLQQTSPEAIEECIFELVNQLNYGTDLITEEKQRTELAKLNLIACRKARSAIAYQAAREYVSIGLSLLGENAWKNQYEMSLAFHDLGAELASLCGNFEEMEHFVETVIINARCLIEQVNVYRIRIQSNVSRNKLIEAITIGLQLLQKFGVTFPKTPTPEEIQHSMAEVCQLIGDSEIEDLVNLPIKTDVEKIAIIQITNSIMTPAYICGSPLTPLLISKSVKLSIQYGNTEDSALAYAAYAIMACNMLKNVDMGVKFGELALRVVSKLDAKAFKPEILDVIGFFILHRKSHIKKTLPIVQEGYAVGLEVGNLQFAGYNTNVFCFNSFWCAQPLATLEQKTRAYCNWLVQLNQLTAANWCRIYWQPILNLLGAAEHPSILSGEALQEAEFLPQLIEAHDSGGLFKFNLCKLMLCFLFGEFESAQKHAVEARRYLVASAGGVCEPAFYFYDSLVILAALTQSEETSELLERVEQNQTQLQQYWAKYAPMNYQHKVDLVAAEKYRILGKKAEAIELYDKAISGAKVNEYTQEEALSNELAAKFYLDWDKEKVASGYVQEAYYCYARWGAKAKTDDLEKRYPQLLAAILQTQQNNLGLNEISSSFNKSSILNQTIQTTRNSTSIDEAFDFASILKASQALSSEIQLEQLISKLIQVVIENAGALKAALILFEQDKLMLKALANTSDIKLLNLPYENSLDIPNTVINYVKRNQKTIVLDDATQNSDFIADSYLIQQQPKSLLCMPILNQGKIIGLLYLENNLTTGAFTQNRVEIINLLCSQAAISLENAQLYSQLKNYSHTLEEKVEQRTQEVRQTLKELQQTQAQLIQNEKMSSLGQLVAGIAHEINNPISFIYGNLTPASEYTLDLIELIDLYQKLYPQPLPEIESKIEDIDLDYLTEDLPKLLDSMQTGAQRIREIVLSLRIFSRLDEAEIKPVDIHSGIDSTLLILQNKLAKNAKYPEIEVIKQYNQLPKVNCYASQLNQVFLNIIGNAIDALRDKYKDKPTITISTSFQDDKNILISIKDNGVGMSKSVLNKIFDPFFSTKPVGSGTGLGLSTSYSIVVEKHQGKLSCNSILGEGTEFLIELPLL
ncbi:MAG: AAA family ATPase [Rivularia sp. (in: cyanobacteria)]